MSNKIAHFMCFVLIVAGSHSLKLLRYTDVTILYTGTLYVTLRKTGYLLQVTEKQELTSKLKPRLYSTQWHTTTGWPFTTPQHLALIFKSWAEAALVSPKTRGEAIF
ncbi:hypothetical protein EB796_014245 [Bugula neritina]|uniref:Secreted protein n=1 Tax=Bugula neritina TaxID=10212 RepID=A0A7J7JPU6_BUGNE|nr:hypothetical protein EB796_014245 [Bugula neritina]